MAIVGRARPTSDLIADIRDTLARLRCARERMPDHETVPLERHFGCELCAMQRRLDWLIDKIPRT